jgi:hypothetical protein
MTKKKTSSGIARKNVVTRNFITFVDDLLHAVTVFTTAREMSLIEVSVLQRGAYENNLQPA